MNKASFDYSHFIHTPADLAAEYVGFAERLQAEVGIGFDIPAVDAHVLPAHAGDEIAFIARPGHCKTSLLAYFARKEGKKLAAAGRSHDRAVVYVTYEQSAEELEAFFQSNEKYTNAELLRGKVQLDDVRRQVLDRAQLPVWIIGHGLSRVDPKAPRMTPEIVYRAIEEMHGTYGVTPHLLLIDYMQLIPIEGTQDRVAAVTEVPIRVKELAMRVGCPAILAVQAGRGVDQRDEKIPALTDAQWASSIEQTCDKVFGLWRPWQTEEHDAVIDLEGQKCQVTETLLIMRMLKQRFESGRWTWPLYFAPQYLKLAALEMQHIDTEWD